MEKGKKERWKNMKKDYVLTMAIFVIKRQPLSDQTLSLYISTKPWKAVAMVAKISQ